MNKRILFFLLAALSLSVFSQQQQTSDKDKNKNEATQPATTLRANVHLVVLDVVALDDHGHPDANLNRGDFVVLEDGKPQEIKQFERSMASTGPVETSKPLAPNEYRNVPAQVPNAVNVVLLDMLNTPVRDQGEARKHLVSFLRGMPKGRQVALYGLDNRLHLIQDFTGNSDTLIAAAERAQGKPSALQQSATDKNADGEWVDDLKHYAFSPDVAARVQNFMKNTDTVKTDMRVGLTLQSLQQLARTLAGVPGRKNLIWLSGGFPLNLEENFDDAHVSTAARNYHDAVEQTATALAQAQIAVYPIDVLGVVVGGVDVTVGGRGMFDTDRSGTIGDVMSEQTTQYSAIHNSMDLLAKNTGGQAFYNGNDLKDAIGRSMDLGSSYYTLAYTPSNTEWNGGLRKIEVKTPGKKVKLVYRRNYYAVPDRKYSLPEMEQILVASMDPEMADSTMLSVDVKLSPGTKGANSLMLECDLDRSQFQFVDADKQKVALIDLAIESWDKNGKASGKVGQTLKIPEGDVAQPKVAFRQELALRPNTATLRIGIMDRSSGRLGTVLVPAIPMSSTAAEAKP
ncbi:MAG TPA: VWA domain-containing protein [Candidatus Angelobacter sp.]|nr:VWA domain-containing protein [Candidatus Angelobacter sp.]